MSTDPNSTSSASSPRPNVSPTGKAATPDANRSAGVTKHSATAVQLRQTLATDKPISADAVPTGRHETFLDHFADEHRRSSVPLHITVTASLVSMLVHAVALIVLGILMLPEPVVNAKQEIVIAADVIQQAVEDLKQQPIPLNVEVPAQIEAVAAMSASNISALTTVSLNNEPVQNNIRIDFADVGIATAPATDLTLKLGGGGAGATSLAGARSATGKKQAVATRGGNDASETAVALALEWFAKHQLPDGGWTFDFKLCPACHGNCRDSGQRATSRNAATALALLPFLAAGQTHTAGKFKNTVLGGLQYLSNPQVNPQLRLNSQGADYTPDGGNFYTQGLCAMALSEAYAVSEDRALVLPAQAALNFIMYAQDRNGGGWRYSPGQPGDVSVTGWCLMALKSGHMGHLQVDPGTIRKCDLFLTSMQAKDGAAYGYDRPADRSTTNAVGLLLRMYMGWKRETPALAKGVEALAKLKPNPKVPYFNYYATQVLHQYEGPLWDEWNRVMRDHLISTQDKKGHQVGSWMVEGAAHDIEAGGRLYVTALNCLTLEVYYRHLPLYKTKSTNDDDF